MPRTYASRQARGFTLVEVLVVLVIIGILGLLAIVRTRQQNAQTAASGLAHEIYALCQQARYSAMSSGKQVQVLISAQNPAAQLRTATALGNTALLDSSFGQVETVVNAHQHVQVVYVAPGVSTSGSPAGLLGTAVAELTFYPNGTLQVVGAATTGATIYISDEIAQHPQRVLLYGRTGFAKVLAQ